MAGEEWARRIVQKELTREVRLYDDQSDSGMYDLCIGSTDAPEIAIECVGAVDQVYTEAWNIGPARGPLKMAVKGDWHVVITPQTRIKTLKKSIEPILHKMEERGVYNAYVDHLLKWDNTELFNELEELKIAHAFCHRQTGSGKVDLGMPGIGGVIDKSGSSIPEWIGDFLREPSKQDVLSKLQRSGAIERHVFVIVSFSGAPWLVESYLTDELVNMPSQFPDLPFPVTGVWIVSSMGKKGIRWDGRAWQTFDSRGEGIDTK